MCLFQKWPLSNLQTLQVDAHIFTSIYFKLLKRSFLQMSQDAQAGQMECAYLSMIRAHVIPRMIVQTSTTVQLAQTNAAAGNSK